MAQRKRQANNSAVDQARTKATLDCLPRPLIEPRPPRKRLWFLAVTAVALVVWAGFLVAMALM